MARCSRCGEFIEWDEGLFISTRSVRRSDSDMRRLCARCGGALRAWLELRREEGMAGMPGPDGLRHGMFEDHDPREEIEVDELMADGRAIGHLPKHPHVTESRTDRRPSGETSSHDDSSSPPVASKLSEEWRWSGLE